MDPIVEKLTEYIRAEFVPDMNGNDLTPTTPLMSSGILDSLAVMALGQFIEDTYQVTIQPHDVNAANFETLEKTAAFIRAKMTSAAA